MIFKTSVRTLLAGLAVTLSATAAEAVPTFFADRTSFETAAGALAHESFETMLTASPVQNFGAFTVTEGIGGLNTLDDTAFAPLVTDGARALTHTRGVPGFVVFEFVTPVTAFGLDISVQGSSLVNFSVNGSTGTANLFNTSQFIGVIDTAPITQIAIGPSGFGFLGPLVGYDNVAYSANGGGNVVASASEPGAVGLAAAGLLGAAALRRRA